MIINQILLIGGIEREEFIGIVNDVQGDNEECEWMF